MSKVVFKSPYAKTGKSVGGNYTSYIAKRDRVDKSINAKKVEINLRYIATRPCVEKVGEHGLFGQEDNINLQKASADIRNHNGIVWMPIISLTREDADRLGYNNAESWLTLLRSKQFEIADAYHIPIDDLVWYAAFHDESYHPHIHMIVYNKNPGSEYLSKKACNDMREMLTKIIFKDELKQIYDERQSLRDQIIDEVYEKMNDFQADIDVASDEFVNILNELKFELAGYKGKKNYRFISPEQKEKVDKVVKVVCQDNNLQALYNEWCRLQYACLGCGKDGVAPRVVLMEDLMGELKEETPVATTTIMLEIGHYLNHDIGNNEDNSDERRCNLVRQNIVCQKEIKADSFAVQYLGKETVIAGLQELKQRTLTDFADYDEESVQLSVKEIDIRISLIEKM